MRYTINLQTIKCINEVNELSAAEEPYVLVTSVKLTSVPGLPPIADFEVFRYGVFLDVDKGETRSNARPAFWGISSVPTTINNRDEVIFIVSLMENDNARPDQYRFFVKAAASVSLASTLTLPRIARASALLRDIRDALNGIDVPIPFALDDDHIASVELRLQSSDLISTGVRDRVINVRNSEGDYRLTFRITAVA